MRVIFCSDPLSPGAPDPAYAEEVGAAERAGLAYDLVSFERLVDEGSPAAAARRVRAADPPELAVYRGWMLRPEDYAQLYGALAAKGLRLINDPAAYWRCHHLPESYPDIEGLTPRTAWLPLEGGLTPERVAEALAPFGRRPAIVKDYVKSRKHEWLEACFIPDAGDRAAAWRVASRFVELQGDALAGGLVFREFAELELVGAHPQSGAPLSLELRCFVLDGAPLAVAPYWDEGAYPEAVEPPAELIAEVAARVPSRLYTVDVARRAGGGWLVVELGDAQVAGLPAALGPDSFYAALAARLA